MLHSHTLILGAQYSLVTISYHLALGQAPETTSSLSCVPEADGTRTTTSWWRHHFFRHLRSLLASFVFAYVLVYLKTSVFTDPARVRTGSA